MVCLHSRPLIHAGDPERGDSGWVKTEPQCHTWGDHSHQDSLPRYWGHQLGFLVLKSSNHQAIKIVIVMMHERHTWGNHSLQDFKISPYWGHQLGIMVTDITHSEYDIDKFHWQRSPSSINLSPSEYDVDELLGMVSVTGICEDYIPEGQACNLPLGPGLWYRVVFSPVPPLKVPSTEKVS